MLYFWFNTQWHRIIAPCNFFEKCKIRFYRGLSEVTHFWILLKPYIVLSFSDIVRFSDHYIIPKNYCEQILAKAYKAFIVFRKPVFPIEFTFSTFKMPFCFNKC